MRSTFSILFYINRQKVKKNGKCPVMGRITVDGKLTQFSTGEEIAPALWNVKKGRSTGKDKVDRELNQKLEEYERKLVKYYNRQVEEDACVTAESLKNALLTAKSGIPMLLAEFRAHNGEYLKGVGIVKSKGSYYSYVHAYNNLEKFIQQKCGLEDIAFRELQPSFIEDFEFFLRFNRGFSVNTVFNVLMKLKHMVHRAISRGMLRKNPFADYKCRQEETARRWLSRTELNRILCNPMANEKAERVRILFIFSAFTGLAYADLHNLSYGDISTDGQGVTWIRLRRKKTGTQAIVPLTGIASDIYSKYRNPTGNDENSKVFNVPYYALIHYYMEEIRQAAGLDALSFHQARHTFSTTVCLSNGVPIETLSRMLGHKNISTTQIYAKITNQKVDEDMQALKKRLDGKYHFPQANHLQTNLQQTAI
ncbi:site-specific integrase [Dysgonomonas macrotermitis]|uniref:Site-specific recombinase XerD n=1 Tax=Dysgonomonas macrotermitis TaxID=1346286 RepID=A0A1M5GWX4_9BACT|nr:site-specific integrase [Dysgonomonas macrotermitis]SHG08223.1 Site-specific recombinase XerD [Dysgonomonas macrotermitis]